MCGEMIICRAISDMQYQVKNVSIEHILFMHYIIYNHIFNTIEIYNYTYIICEVYSPFCLCGETNAFLKWACTIVLYLHVTPRNFFI